MTANAVNFTFRRCCEAATSPAFFVDTTDRPSLGRGDEVHVSEPIQIVREPRVARHEASHAAVAHVIGVPIKKIHLDQQPQVITAGACESATGRIALSLAGLVADDIFYGSGLKTIGPIGFKAAMRRIRSCRFGLCDECVAALNSLAAAGGASASDRDAYRVFRRVERAVGIFLQKPETEVAVSNLAAALMEHGVIDGATAHEIMSAANLPALDL
jgi:hypothetical protein